MNKAIFPRKIPEHLIGTREGLFHLLQAQTFELSDEVRIAPARPRRQSCAPHGRADSLQPPVSVLDDVLSSDDFHFNL